MDEILEKFNSTLVAPNNSKDYSLLYKNCGRHDTQEMRRQELLRRQKEDRTSRVDRLRGILNNITDFDDDENNKRVRYRPKLFVAGFTEAANTYRDIHMLSEWMVEKPITFENDWFVTPCPVGKRLLLIANRNSTSFYNKNGYLIFKCATALPGGGSNSRKSSGVSCVLDGVYCDKSKTFYILDVLSWKQHNMADGEACFRQYWLESQLAEIPEASQISKKNEVKFTALIKQPCDTPTLNKLFMKYPPFENDTPKIDGFLFYHKHAHYFSGETPLVGWLYPYMLQEILGQDLTVHESYLASKPPDYVNQAQFIENYENKRKEKQLTKENKKKKKEEAKQQNMVMDTAPVETTDQTEATDQKEPIDQNPDESAVSMDIAKSLEKDGEQTEKMDEGNNENANSKKKRNKKKNKKTEKMDSDVVEVKDME